MDMPLISVIVPVYNVEKYLKECIDSVIGQTYRNIEIILVDDGSTDSSGEMADAFARQDTRIVVIHKKNGGLSDARNKGIEAATGEYITFVDSDDYLSVTFIERLLSVARDTGADIVQCDNSRDPSQIDTGGGGIRALGNLDGFIALMKFQKISPTAWGKLYKISLFQNNHITFPVGRIYEDTAVLYKLVYLSDSIATVDSTLYYYRRNSASITMSNYTDRHYNSVLQYHDELDDFIAEQKITIHDHIMNRHKALRLLSVLNKLAKNHQDTMQTYSELRKRYMYFSKKSQSPLCYIGVLAVYSPGMFRALSSSIELARRRVGKA